MTDGQLGHVVPLLAQGNEVVVNASLVLASIVEIELFGLDVVFAQFLLFELCDFFEEALFLLHRHAPDDDDTILEEEDFGDVHRGVEVGRHGAIRQSLGRRFIHSGILCGVRLGEFAGFRVALQVNQVFSPPLGVLGYLNGTVGETPLRL